MDIKQELHDRFNPRFDQIPPVRIKSFTREKLAMLAGELGIKRVAEIGVAEGIYSATMCLHIPDIELICIDLWDTYYRVDKPESPLKNRQMQDRCFGLAHEKLDKYNARFIHKDSMAALADIPDGSLDMVYIDANHGFDYIMCELIHWSKKVKRGGIVAGHDYYRFRGAGVVNAVDAYTHAHQINEWFLDDQRETSFFWANDWR